MPGKPAASAKVFGDGQPPVPVFAAKSYFGNLGAGSGTTELAASLLALKHGTLPRDAELRGARSRPARSPCSPRSTEAVDTPYVLKVGFTEMGQCAAVVCRKWEVNVIVECHWSVAHDLGTIVTIDNGQWTIDHEKTRRHHRNGRHHAAGPQRGGAVRSPARGQERRRADHAVRRQHVPDQVRRPGQGLRPGPATSATPSRWEHSGVNSRFAAAAAQQALDDAGLLDDRTVDRTRFGVYLGSGEGIQDFHHLVSLVAQSYRPDKRDGRYARPSPRAACASFHPGREFEQELHTTPATWPTTSTSKGRTTTA